MRNVYIERNGAHNLQSAIATKKNCLPSFSQWNGEKNYVTFNNAAKLLPRTMRSSFSSPLQNLRHEAMEVENDGER